MSDQGFHEIQLSAKQLVFLFMAGVVVAVGVFLLGVSVGRGVRSSVVSAADAGAPGDTMANASTPTATKVTPADLDYREKLQGAAGAAAAGAVVGAAASTPPPAKPVDPPQPPPDGPPAETKPPLKPAPNSTLLSMAATPTPTPAAKAAATPPAAKTAAPKPTPAATKPAASDGSWTVQLDAFSNKATADNLVKQLKAKGYASAFIVSSATLYKVRVGTFTDHGDAEKMASRLAKDGYRPLVTR
jgi:DedD protein